MAQYSLRGETEVPSWELLGAVNQIVGQNGYKTEQRTVKSPTLNQYGLPNFERQLVVKENGHGPKGFKGLLKKAFGQDVIAKINVPSSGNISTMNVEGNLNIIPGFDQKLTERLQRASSSYKI